MKTRALVLGAGYRGRAYASYASAHPDELEIVGVADPVQAEAIPAAEHWADWREALNANKAAELAIIALPDALHYEAARAFLERGYHVLVEKPLADDFARSQELVDLAAKAKRMVMVAHELRYSPYFAHIKELIDSGELGEVVSIAQQESVNFRKFAHSFVRGSLASAKKSSPIVISKCSHDLDLFSWWLKAKCKKVTSFGSTKLFKRENAPQGSAERCEGCPLAQTCVWSAQSMYLENGELGYMFADRSREAMEELVRSSPYGRCVFKCDNDVPDHQTVAMEFEGGATATLVMSAFTARNIRTTRVSLTHGEIIGDGEELKVVNFANGRTATIPAVSANRSRHNGGDFGLVADTLAVIRRNDAEEFARVSCRALESHRIGFAAEESRLDGGRTVLL